MSDYIGKAPTQFAADGGLLANRPIGPALQAVFDRHAESEVRRVLAFIVPTVGGSAQPPSAEPTLANPPGTAAALAADLGAAMAQTISTDLNAISVHNQQVRARNDTRQQLAALGNKLPDRLGKLFYQHYRDRRAASIARAASDEVMTRVTLGSRAPDGRPMGYGDDAQEAWLAADTKAKNVLSSELPEIGEYAEMNAAGREALDEGRATVLAVLRCAFHMTLPALQQEPTLGDLRRQLGEAMPERTHLSQADVFKEALGPAPHLPAAPPDATTPAYQVSIAAHALLASNKPPP
jgi:hypothetical protein